MSPESNPPIPPGAIQPAGTPPPNPGAFAAGTPPGAAPPIVLSNPASAKPTEKPKTPAHHDSFREFIETIVFVVVLVLILKTFLAEAFVIPTGSMATTLLGYHGEVTCKQCSYRFLVNKSKEADPAEQHKQAVTSCTCPNCFFVNDLRPRNPQGGLP